MLTFLFGCEEEQAFRLHTAPEYYQGRAMLPSGQLIEMTEADRKSVLDACYPEDALALAPAGDRRWIGTVTLSQPLTTNDSTPVFPTATFFEAENQTFVECQVDTITYMKQIAAVPDSLAPFHEQAVTYPSVAKLRNAQPHERLQFLKEMDKPFGNEPYPTRTAFEQTLVHLTMPFSGSFELTFESLDGDEQVTIPIDAASRQPFRSIGFGVESTEEAQTYGVYTSPNQEVYDEVRRPKDASFDRLLGVRQAETLPTTLVSGERYPLFSFSFMRDDVPHKKIVSITYHEPILLRGEALKREMRAEFSNRQHAVFHELALIGTESRDASFLTHLTADDTRFIFKAIERAKATPESGQPSDIPYLTVFEGICAQTFDVSFKGDDVVLTNTKTGAHFKLLRDDANKWHDRFDD
nr:hypothetical protein [Exiguobacterium sp. s122]